MSVSASHRSKLHARRIRQRVLVARSHPNPERVRLQLHSAISTHLHEALGAAFAQAGATDEDVVWRIRHLALDVSVNATWDDRRLARALALQLAQAIRRAIEQGGDGITVIRFDGRAAYLASFLREIADGTAWTRWWFESFVGLKLLSRTATIRTALVREPALGAEALAAMSVADAGLVVAHLSNGDARTVLDALSPAFADGDADEAASAVLSAYRRLGAPSVRDDEDRWVLKLIAEAVRAAPRRTPRTCVEVARAMARLAHVSQSGATRIAIVRRLLLEGNAAALHLVIESTDAERLAPLARLGRTHIDAILDTFVEPSASTPAHVDDRRGQADWMPVAAPLLLAPLVAALPLDPITRGWPTVGGEHDPAMRRASAAALVRLFVMAIACGGERAARVLADPSARLLAGVGSAVTTAEVRTWLDTLTVAHAARLEWMLGEWRIAERIVGLETWLLARPTASIVLLDCSRGHWLALRDDDRAMSSLRRWLNTPGPSIRSERELTAITARGETDSLGGSSDRSSHDAITATLARADRLGAEIEWLKLPGSIGVPRVVELALAVAAQGILRDLAWRIPGFARATLPYLWTNFLSIDAHVEHAPQGVTAVLSKPPLAPVMSMTGMMRSTYRLPWCGGRTVALFPAEGR